MKDILIITPPFTQLNTPYPASAYIKGFLNTKSIPAFQMDLGIEVILELFSKEGLTTLFQVDSNSKSENSNRIYSLKDIALQEKRYIIIQHTRRLRCLHQNFS